MTVTVNQENEFKELLARSSNVIDIFKKDGHEFTVENGAELVRVGLAYVELDPTGELLQAQIQKKQTIDWHEVYVANGMDMGVYEEINNPGAEPERVPVVIKCQVTIDENGKESIDLGRVIDTMAQRGYDMSEVELYLERIGIDRTEKHSTTGMAECIG
jgi:hypothetical protein